MISFDSRYYGNAHRISDLPLKSTVTTLYDGQWVMLDTDGNAVLHDGTDSKRGFLTISSKYGDVGANIGRTITQGPAGRDNVSSTGMITVLVGPFRLATDRYETDSYAVGDWLKISTTGDLEKATIGSDPWYSVVATVWEAPATAGAPMTIVSV